ncbi:MAG: PAC2 family protein [Bifidobacteriaceae bacterium]|jgi:predicted ATP-grasp superfamily ATP-dependent carboligase|nr:PAC2 family protein [Bifidobacteriaceae bacterium]
MPSPRRAASRIAVAAFAGWNDAGSAATDALSNLLEQWGAVPFVELDSEDFHDFQVTRPRFVMDNGERRLILPRTRLFEAVTPGGRGAILIDGIEPSMRWEQYCREILVNLVEHRVSTLVCLGALLADVPHTRPIPVTGSSNSKKLRERYGLERSEYTGPTGIVGMLDHYARETMDLPSMSLWAAVPHYVANPPSPKAVLALLTKLEEVVGEPIDTGDLPEEARAWGEGVDTLAAEDDDVAEYVAQLEAAKDAVDSPEASGEALAQEFQRYLQRREQGGPGGRPRG